MQSIGERSRSAFIWRRRAYAFSGAALSLLRRFRTNESGNIAIMAAITLPVTAGAIGVALSYSTVNAVRSNMQAALDAAVLAGAGALDAIGGSDPITTANDVFTGNVSKLQSTDCFQTARRCGIDPNQPVGLPNSRRSTNHVNRRPRRLTRETRTIRNDPSVNHLVRARLIASSTRMDGSEPDLRPRSRVPRWYI